MGLHDMCPAMSEIGRGATERAEDELIKIN